MRCHLGTASVLLGGYFPTRITTRMDDTSATSISQPNGAILTRSFLMLSLRSYHRGSGMFEHWKEPISFTAPSSPAT